eukprot:scaffold16969_cov61-Phaeocystis_antarctica.AAC.4
MPPDTPIPSACFRGRVRNGFSEELGLGSKLVGSSLAQAPALPYARGSSLGSTSLIGYSETRLSFPRSEVRQPRKSTLILRCFRAKGRSAA